MTPTREQIQAAIKEFNTAHLVGLHVEDLSDTCVKTIRSILQAALDDQDDMLLTYMIGYEKGKEVNRIPEGYRLVPLEPTDEMVDRGNDALSPWIAPAMHSSHADKAMLDAAPTPTGEKK